MRWSLKLILCIVAIAVMTITPAMANAPNGWTSVWQDISLYGHVNNSGPWCAPTCTTNSFVYLWNAYPEVYASTNLIPDYDNNGVIDHNDHVDARDELAGYMNCSDDKGAYSWEWWNGKLAWFNDHAPGTTAFSGQISGGVSADTYNNSQWLTGNTYPQWDYLWDGLSDGHDIELGILGFIENKGWVGHGVTLTGLAFDDTSGDGEWDWATEDAQIAYADPNQSSWSSPMVADLTWTGSRLEFEWWQSQSNFYVDLAYSEGPIEAAAETPEPATWVLLVCTASIAALKRRRSA